LFFYIIKNFKYKKGGGGGGGVDKVPFLLYTFIHGILPFLLYTFIVASYLQIISMQSPLR